MKKLFSLLALLVLTLMLTACWPAEIAVHTTINADGSGTRTYVIDIMDDTLSEDPIINPDDPDEEEGKGAVLNDKHVTGGVIAIQTWLEENAPDFMTIHEAEVEGYHRYFKMSFDFSSFEDFLAKYEILVNLSPNLDWDVFDDSEKPQLKVEGFLEKTITFYESKDILQASVDWAIQGIWDDIYDQADLAGLVTKDDISVLANVYITVGNTEYKVERYYDPEAEEGNAEEHTGKIIFVEETEFEVTGKAMDTLMLILISLGGLVVVGGVGVGVYVLVKKRK